MGALLLVICVIVALKMSVIVASLSHLGSLLVMPRWFVGTVILVLVTWLIRE